MVRTRIANVGKSPAKIPKNNKNARSGGGHVYSFSGLAWFSCACRRETSRRHARSSPGNPRKKKLHGKKKKKTSAACHVRTTAQRLAMSSQQFFAFFPGVLRVCSTAPLPPSSFFLFFSFRFFAIRHPVTKRAKSRKNGWSVGGGGIYSGLRGRRVPAGVQPGGAEERGLRRPAETWTGLPGPVSTQGPAKARSGEALRPRGGAWPHGRWRCSSWCRGGP